jgi:hypothetical protein
MATTSRSGQPAGYGPAKPASSVTWVVIVAVLLVLLAAAVLYLL